MINNDLSNLGEQISDIVQNAVDSKNFEKLNLTINNTISGAMNTLKNELHNAQYSAQNTMKSFTPPQYTTAVRKDTSKKTKKSLFARTNGARAGGIALSIVGYTLSFLLGLGIIAISILPVPSYAAILSLASMAPLALLTLFMGIKGTAMISRAHRFQTYVTALQGKTYGNINSLASAVGKSVSFVRKDLRKMIAAKWFKEGALDDDGANLIISHETFQEYRKTQDQFLEEKSRQEQIEEAYSALPDQTRAMIKEGNEYITKIREKKNEIKEPEMSAKLSDIEAIIQKIFHRVEEHPEVIPELRKMMEYYLPTTMKLLDAYTQLDSQPVQGSNIISAKAEIESSLDTLIPAFEKLLDNLFKDVAWDVSSDIAVLHAMLAQEGLTKNAFEKIK